MHSLRKFGLLIVFEIVALIFQASILGAFLPAYLMPQLMLLLVVFFGFYEATVLGVALSFAAGVILDLASGLIVGPWAAAFVLVHGGLAGLSQRLFVESTFAAITTTFLSCLGADLVYALLVFEFQAVDVFQLAQFFGQACATAVLSPLLFKPFRKVWTKRERSISRRAFRTARS